MNVEIERIRAEMNMMTDEVKELMEIRKKSSDITSKDSKPSGVTAK